MPRGQRCVRAATETPCLHTAISTSKGLRRAIRRSLASRWRYLTVAPPNPAPFDPCPFLLTCALTRALHLTPSIFIPSVNVSDYDDGRPWFPHSKVVLSEFYCKKVFAKFDRRETGSFQKADVKVRGGPLLPSSIHRGSPPSLHPAMQHPS